MADVHPTAIVSDGAVLGADVVVGPFCIVGASVVLKDRVRLISNVVVEGPSEIGADCTVHPYAVLGGPPQVLGFTNEQTRLEIGERNVIREYVTMHRGTPKGRGVTSVGSDSLFMAQAHVAHDCIVADRVIMAQAATLGGHVVVGEFAIIGGLAAVHQFGRIGPHVNIGGLAAVTKDVIPFGSAWGNHAHLEGLNLVGLKRRGFTRETVNDLRSAYRLLFADEGTFQERVEDTARVFAASPHVMQIVDFIRADANRPLCLPARDV
jgi:UDP-N-acetylglucosamine acyltransferase